MSDIDKVAEAIWRADENAHEPTWSDVNPRWRDHYWRLAEAAVAALKAQGYEIGLGHGSCGHEHRQEHAR